MVGHWREWGTKIKERGKGGKQCGSSCTHLLIWPCRVLGKIDKVLSFKKIIINTKCWQRQQPPYPLSPYYKGQKHL